MWRRKVRTFLTILGVIIGTAAIVVMISLSVGIDQALEKQLAEMGDLSTIEVYGGYNMETGKETKLDDKLVKKIREIPHVKIAVPVLYHYGQLQADRYENHVSIMGVEPEAMQHMGLKVAQGRLLEPGDKMQIVYGGSVPYNFYKPQRGGGGGMIHFNTGGPDEPPPVDVMTARIRFVTYIYTPSGEKTKDYRVETAGVLESEGYGRYNHNVFMNIETVKEMKKEENRQGNRPSEAITYSHILVWADDVENNKQVIEEIRALGSDAYSMSMTLEEVKKSTANIRLILGGIGGVSMLVAALGITNTMIMSIYERTREIGIMKVLGSKLSDIGKLFIVEAVLIGLFGGIAGVGLSYAVSYFLNNFIPQMGGMMIPGSQMSVIPVGLVVFALAFTSGVGLISGLYPAIRAMRLSALEAIRTE